MEKKEELDKKVKRLWDRRELGLSEEDVIELCFEIMSEHPDKIEQSRAAVVLSGIVKKGLGKRTLDFLKANPHLPARVHQVLRNSIMRMETF